MLNVTKIVQIVLLLAITSVGCGQPSEPPYKLKYENSPDLPNGIAFLMMLGVLDALNMRVGPDDSAEWVEIELRLSGADSHAFVTHALTTLDRINADVKTAEVRLACEYAGPNVAKEDQYNALQQMYDIEKAVYDHYYDQTKAGLDVEVGERLQQWVDDQKLSIGHFEIDFEKSYQKRGGDPADTLSRMCGVAK